MELAPVSPPCFSDRLSWLEYVEAAEVAARREHTPGPLLIVAGEPVRFDPNFDYCSDCDVAYRSAMLKQGRCDPESVRRRATPDEETLPLFMLVPTR